MSRFLKNLWKPLAIWLFSLVLVLGTHTLF